MNASCSNEKKTKKKRGNTIRYNEKMVIGLRLFKIAQFEFTFCRHLDRIFDRLLRVFSSRQKLQRPLLHS